MSTASISAGHSRRGLFINALGAVVLALVTNGIIFAAGWGGNSDGEVQASFAPPGWAVGSVWLVLFALMGAARWLARENQLAKNFITVLIVACALYPFYTGGLQTQWVALVGTLITIVIGVIAFSKARRVSATAAGLVVPVLIWSVFAAAIIVEGIRLN